MDSTTQKENRVTSLVSYIKESITELKKVEWPTRKQALQETVTVIVVSVATAIFLGVLDYGFSYLIQKIL